MKTFKLVHLGARYERAFQRADYAEQIRIERELDRVQRENSDWITPWVVRGRNFVRARRNLTELHA